MIDDQPRLMSSALRQLALVTLLLAAPSSAQEPSPSAAGADVWPMGTVSGILKVKQKGLPLPKQVLVKTLAAPAFAKRLPSPKGALDCPVDEKARGRAPCLPPPSTWSSRPRASSRGDVLRRDLRVALFQNGLQIPPNVYGQWAHEHGQSLGTQSLRIPNVAPGEYRICLVPMRLPLEGDPAASGAECTSGLLFRGGTLELRLGS